MGASAMSMQHGKMVCGENFERYGWCGKMMCCERYGRAESEICCRMDVHKLCVGYMSSV